MDTLNDVVICYLNWSDWLSTTNESSYSFWLYCQTSYYDFSDYNSYSTYDWISVDVYYNSIAYTLMC